MPQNVNGFTNVTKEGSSVVDYFLVPHAHLKQCTSFCVQTCTDIANNLGLHSFLNSKCKLPDHALLTMEFVFETRLISHTDSSKTLKAAKPRYKLNKIPEHFLNNPQWQDELIRLIDRIESCRENQTAIDDVYTDLVKSVIHEMDSKIPQKPTNTCPKKHNKIRQPFWNDKLNELWKQVCQAEKQFKKCTIRYMKRDLQCAKELK